MAETHKFLLRIAGCRRVSRDALIVAFVPGCFYRCRFPEKRQGKVTRVPALRAALQAACSSFATPCPYTTPLQIYTQFIHIVSLSLNRSAPYLRSSSGGPTAAAAAGGAARGGQQRAAGGCASHFARASSETVFTMLLRLVHKTSAPHNLSIDIALKSGVWSGKMSESGAANRSTDAAFADRPPLPARADFSLF